jgi:quinol monooxygenase YgiN
VADPQLLLLADVHGLAGRRGELATLLEELAAGSREENACVAFRVLAAEDPADFTMLASWADEQGMREHYDTPHYRRYREQVGPLLARPSDVVVHRLSGTVRALNPNPPDPGDVD